MEGIQGGRAGSHWSQPSAVRGGAEGGKGGAEHHLAGLLSEVRIARDHWLRVNSCEGALHVEGGQHHCRGSVKCCWLRLLAGEHWWSGRQEAGHGQTLLASETEVCAKHAGHVGGYTHASKRTILLLWLYGVNAATHPAHAYPSKDEPPRVQLRTNGRLLCDSFVCAVDWGSSAAAVACRRTRSYGRPWMATGLPGDPANSVSCKAVSRAAFRAHPQPVL